ncbi:MAG TPA: hypothetical protein VFO85_19180 [Vicinamibacteria bacterium]|nr:hypothetical protein [Vicinamibacteria bacterium]
MTALLLALQFSPTTSTYQRLKIELLSLVHLSKDAVHVYVGVGCLLATLAVMRRVRWKALLPGLVVSLAMEVVDLRDNWRDEERLRWKASLHDVLNTNALPVVLVAFLRRRWIRSG